MPAETLTLGWLLNKAWVLLLGIYWYGKKNLDIDNKKRDEEIAKLTIQASTFVTEHQVKETLREALEPYKEDQQEIKVLLRSLHDQIITLSKDMAVQSAIRSITNDQQSNGDR